MIKIELYEHSGKFVGSNEIPETSDPLNGILYRNRMFTINDDNSSSRVYRYYEIYYAHLIHVLDEPW